MEKQKHKPGIVKISSLENEIPLFRMFSVIGDPGCDGLGAATMSIFARALKASDGDFTVIAGDIVHKGIQKLYGNVYAFVNAVSENPVYMLCGNHDTAFYDDYFGLKNYLLYNDDVLLIFLDDSSRKFEEKTLLFLEQSLKKYQNRQTVLFFHIPPPNNMGTNTINHEEWKKFSEKIKPYCAQIRYIVCGHVHSYYEDNLEGIPLIVTGGGGARIEYVSEKVDPQKAFHHIVQFFFDGNHNLSHKHVSLEEVPYLIELQDEKLKKSLELAFSNEAAAHVQYLFYAEDAQSKGFNGLAKMFRAFADAEFYHARNHFYVLSKMDTMLLNAAQSIENEAYEIDHLYPKDLNYARENGFGLAAYSFHDAREAERIHHQLLTDALIHLSENQDIDLLDYYTCTSCGYTMKGTSKPENCPICGAPSDKIKEVH